MEETLTVTKSQLEEAFKKWNKDYLDGSREFAKDIDEKSHIGQAENLIEYLREV